MAGKLYHLINGVDFMPLSFQKIEFNDRWVVSRVTKLSRSTNSYSNSQRGLHFLNLSGYPTVIFDLKLYGVLCGTYQVSVDCSYLAASEDSFTDSVHILPNTANISSACLIRTEHI
jgi:hypothetical protein